MANRFQKTVDNINSLVKSGVLESEDERFLKKALKDFKHALSVKDSQQAEKSVNKFCKRLLEIMQELQP